MPPAYVKAIREWIFYKYSKLILISVYGSPSEVLSPSDFRKKERPLHG
jgi:hypothetical protein